MWTKVWRMPQAEKRPTPTPPHLSASRRPNPSSSAAIVPAAGSAAGATVCTARSSTMEVASFTTPSPNTSAYSMGAASWKDGFVRGSGGGGGGAHPHLHKRTPSAGTPLRAPPHTWLSTCRVATLSVDERMAPRASELDRRFLSARPAAARAR